MQVADPIASALKTLDCDEEAKEVMQLGGAKYEGTGTQVCVSDFWSLYLGSFYFYLWCCHTYRHCCLRVLAGIYEYLCNLYTSILGLNIHRDTLNFYNFNIQRCMSSRNTGSPTGPWSFSEHGSPLSFYSSAVSASSVARGIPRELHSHISSWLS